MSRLLNKSIRTFLIYAAVVLVCSIPAYYYAIRWFWDFEVDEHNIILSEEASMHDTFMILSSVTVLTTVFFVILLGGFVLLNKAVSRKLWQPFYKSLDEIRKFDLAENKSVDFGDTDIDEFTKLHESLNKLIAGNIAAYNQQKEFADNASHELQTPLAVVQTKLGLLLQSKSLTREQFDTIEEALSALSRVTRINKNLLLLTKIENSQYQDKEEIDWSILLDKSVEQLGTVLEGRGLTIHKKISPGIRLMGNRSLVEILVNNLLTNAIRHSSAGSDICIHLTDAVLAIRNAGTEALDSNNLFKRFATASSKNPGTGLGLALAKQVCLRYNWSIAYNFEENMHIFSVTF